MLAACVLLGLVEPCALEGDEEGGVGDVEEHSRYSQVCQSGQPGPLYHLWQHLSVLVVVKGFAELSTGA